MAGNKKVRYIAVAPCVPLGKRGQDSYTYFISSENEIFLGSVVKIPFGKRSIMGVVTALDLQRPSYPTKQVKTITKIQLTHIQMQFSQWLADVCHGGFGFTARLFLPGLFAQLTSSARMSFQKKKIEKPLAIIENNANLRMDLIIKHAHNQKGQVLIVVPEVAMLSAYEKLLAPEIRNNTAMIYHAGLLQSEKKRVWQAVESSDCRIVIGTQKALFLPFYDLASVVIDEEQSGSYKLWDQYPRLHTVFGAQMLAQFSHASLFYAASYPSLFLRHAIAEKTCDVLVNNPVIPKTRIYPFSFEDRKWKRVIPEELGNKVRTWARSGKHVLVLFNKKDDVDLKKSLFRKLSAIAKKHMHIGTVGMLTHPARMQFDYVVWLFPEWTLRSIDYRSSERAKITSARLAEFTIKGDVYIGTRYADIARDLFDLSEKVWEEKALKQRKRFHLPPYTQLVRLTIRDKTTAKASTKALDLREIIDKALKNKKEIEVAGPYQELGAKKKLVHEYQILLSGELKKLVPLYKKLPVDSADVAPYKVV